MPSPFLQQVIVYIRKRDCTSFLTGRTCRPVGTYTDQQIQKSLLTIHNSRKSCTIAWKKLALKKKSSTFAPPYPNNTIDHHIF